MEEIWKDIPGYEGVYALSNMGNVRSSNMRLHTSVRDRKLAFYIVQGVKLVKLFKPDGSYKMPAVHKLVAQLFVPNDDIRKTAVRRINGDKMDCRAENLEWYKPFTTDGSQLARAAKKRGRPERQCYKSFEKPIRAYKDGKFFAEYKSMADCQRALGIQSSSNIRDVLIGKYKQIKGYTFKYKNIKPKN